ncbi:MAG: alpha/beta hydrolase [Chloroflexi bacterium]|nr:alpha/beta hydrolase [Chloroflexota bacterium]
MSSIIKNKGIVHYEVFGRGQPVILLHGWLGSWGLWQETMSHLGQGYRTDALDFWGFGESGKKRESYAIQDFVSLVDQFMHLLGIQRAPLVGHSMGGTVALLLAIQHPGRVSRVVVVGSPIVGSALAPALKLAGRRRVAAILFKQMWAFRLGMRIVSSFICRDARFAEMMARDLSCITLESFLFSIASLHRTDLRPRLPQIQVPVLGMFGKRDNIVHPMQWQPLKEGIPQARIERFPQAGHFIMLDEPVAFMHKLKEFLDEKT